MAVEVELDPEKAAKLGHNPASIQKALKRAQRWMIANPYDRRPPRHIAEAVSVLRPKTKDTQ